MKRWTPYGHYYATDLDITKLSQAEIDEFCIKCGAGFNFSGCSSFCKFAGKAFRKKNTAPMLVRTEITFKNGRIKGLIENLGEG